MHKLIMRSEGYGIFFYITIYTAESPTMDVLNSTNNMQKSLVVVAIVLIIVVAWRWSSPLTLVIAGMVAAVIYYKYHGGYGCDPKQGSWSFGGDYTKPYGSRCINDGTPCPKQECEIYSLSPDESLPTMRNIIAMTYGSGINMPMPRKFMEKIANNPAEFDAFASSSNRQMIVNYLKYCDTSVFKQLTSRLSYVTCWHMSITEIIKGDNNYEYMRDHADECADPDQVRQLVANIDKFGAALCDNFYKITNGIDFHDIGNVSDALSSRNQIAVIFTTMYYSNNTAHANILLINHSSRSIYHFDSNTGRDLDQNIGNYLFDFAYPLIEQGYTFAGSHELPLGLQSMTRDPTCASWSLFAALLMALNPEKKPGELFNYMVAIEDDVLTLLDIFLYFIWKKYSNIFSNNNKYALIVSAQRGFDQLDNYLNGFQFQQLVSRISYNLGSARHAFSPTIQRICDILCILRDEMAYLVNLHLDTEEFAHPTADTFSPNFVVNDAIAQSKHILDIILEMSGSPRHELLSSNHNDKLNYDAICEDNQTILREMATLGTIVTDGISRNIYSDVIDRHDAECVLF